MGSATGTAKQSRRPPAAVSRRSQWSGPPMAPASDQSGGSTAGKLSRDISSTRSSVPPIPDLDAGGRDGDAKFVGPMEVRRTIGGLWFALGLARNILAPRSLRSP